MVINNGPTPPSTPPEDGPENSTTDVTAPTPEPETPALNTLNANPSFEMPGDESVEPQVAAEPVVPAGPTPEELAEVARVDAEAKARELGALRRGRQGRSCGSLLRLRQLG